MGGGGVEDEDAAAQGIPDIDIGGGYPIKQLVLKDINGRIQTKELVSGEHQGFFQASLQDGDATPEQIHKSLGAPQKKKIEKRCQSSMLVKIT